MIILIIEHVMMFLVVIFIIETFFFFSFSFIDTLNDRIHSHWFANVPINVHTQLFRKQWTTFSLILPYHTLNTATKINWYFPLLRYADEINGWFHSKIDFLIRQTEFRSQLNHYRIYREFINSLRGHYNIRIVKSMRVNFKLLNF